MSQDWEPQFTHTNVSVEEDTVICDSFYQMRRITVEHERFEGGSVQITRDLFWRPDAVCVLLFDPKLDSVVLIEQFRVGTIDHPRSPWLLELVAGLVEPGESPSDVAYREAIEEAGARVVELEHISRFTPSPGGAREYIDLYCACVDSRLISGVHGLEDEGEDIKVHHFSTDQVFHMIQTGDIDNAPAIIAIQWLQLNKDRLATEWGNL